ncbi:hypothetical protein O181_012489 [Austropuccinia psidii MF-1]|uniref:Reverse transcriptase/retrotransposon-derived protein RNase H-like domain-containing protein n=1 Tax=Austropuccinia psidii MF-1 TaxID=1389203 RepID=A0A9Q3BWH3_9BASI|nr:hypothetical protein [Austropuccinia psidii MF-1]
MTVDRVKAFESLRKELTTAPLLLMPDCKLTFKLYIDQSGDGLGASFHQVQIINDKPVEGAICFISRQIKPTEARYGESKMECLCLVLVLEKLNYFLETPNRHMLRWKIAIQKYSCNMNIFHKDGNIHKNADVLRKWPLQNNIDNPAYVAEEGSPQNPIEGISITELNTTFFEEVRNSYSQDKNCSIFFQLITKDCRDNSFLHALDEIWRKSCDEGRSHLLDGIISHRIKHACVMKVLDRSLINLVLKQWHDSPFAGHLPEGRKREETKMCIWWLMWQKDVSEYCRSCHRFKKGNKSTGKGLGNMIKIQEPSRT